MHEHIVKIASLSITPLSMQPESIITDSHMQSSMISVEDSDNFDGASTQQLPLVPPAVNVELQKAREKTQKKQRSKHQLMRLDSFQFCLRNLPVIKQLSAMMIEQKTTISGAHISNEYEASESGTSICSH